MERSETIAETAKHRIGAILDGFKLELMRKTSELEIAKMKLELCREAGSDGALREFLDTQRDLGVALADKLDLEKKLEESNRKLEESNRKLEESNSKLEESNLLLEGVNCRLVFAESELEAANDEVAKLKASNAANTKEINKLEKEVEALSRLLVALLAKNDRDIFNSEFGGSIYNTKIRY